MDTINYLEDRDIAVFDSEGNDREHSKTIRMLTALRIINGEKTVCRYDIDRGFHKIKNPGWIVFDLKSVKQVSYIRFLLWDNCGSDKKQPSRRKYLYRLLVAGEKVETTQGQLVFRWEAVYDTMHNGSNGWQEFYFESKPSQIRYIKLYTMSNSRDQYTHLVNIQAYEYPTQLLYDYSKGVDERSRLEMKEEKHFRLSRFGWWHKKEEVMPMAPPIHGLINNRIIIGNENQEISYTISLNVFKRVSAMLAELSENMRANTELENIKKDIAERLNELYAIDKELQCFQNSIYYPLIRNFQRQRRRTVLLAIVVNLALIITIAQSIYDFISAFGTEIIKRLMSFYGSICSCF